MTTSCDRWRNPIADVAAGAPAAPELEQHLAACAACRQALLAGQGLHARIDGELRHALGESPSPSLLPLVRQQLSHPTTPWMSLLVPAAAGLALLAFSISEWPRAADPSPRVRTVGARPAAQARVEAPALGRSEAPRAAVTPETRRSAPRSAAGLPFSPASLILDHEPIAPAALVIAPLDAPPPIETKPLVTVGLDSEGAER